MKARAAASSAILAVLLATSTYSMKVSEVVRSVIGARGEPHGAKTPDPAPVVGDYDSRLSPADTAVDSSLATSAAPMLGAGGCNRSADRQSAALTSMGHKVVS